MASPDQHIKHFLQFSVKEQSAILTICVLLLGLLMLNLFPEVTGSQPKWDYQRFDSAVRHYYAQIRIQDSLDALKPDIDFISPDKSALQQKFTLFPFNPNMLPEEEWKRLGMADHQISMIKNYERKGGRFFRKEDLRRIYAISDAEYAILEPYIRIPKVEQPISERAEKKTGSHEKEPEPSPPPIPVIEINQADSTALMQLPQIGSWFSRRIIQYRENLGGYSHAGQLLEVYNMDSSRFEIFKPYITIDSTLIRPRLANHDDFRSLLSHPYISFELTRLIVNHRERRGMIRSWDELLALPGADTLTSAGLQPYLSFE